MSHAGLSEPFSARYRTQKLWKCEINSGQETENMGGNNKIIRLTQSSWARAGTELANNIVKW